MQNNKFKYLYIFFPRNEIVTMAVVSKSQKPVPMIFSIENIDKTTFMTKTFLILDHILLLASGEPQIILFLWYGIMTFVSNNVMPCYLNYDLHCPISTFSQIITYLLSFIIFHEYKIRNGRALYNALYCTKSLPSIL